MPVLGGARIVGLVDPGRRDNMFVAKQVTLLDSAGVSHVAAAMMEAASWVGCDGVVLERVEPVGARSELVSLVRDGLVHGA
jgi:hypothetical protein